MYFGKIKLFIVGLVFLLLTPGIAQSQVCTATCGDLDNQGGLNIDDIPIMFDYLTGGAAQVDSICANVDGRFGITISDLIRLADVGVWWYNQFPNCNGGLFYNYLPTPEDTVYFPRMTSIPDTFDKVELPIFISYFDRRSAEGMYLPFLPLGLGSNSAFATDPPDSAGRVFYNIKPDTVLNVDFRFGPINGSSPGKILSGVIRYRRSTTGVGQIVPEIVNKFDLKRMALAKLDSLDQFSGDLYIPTVKSYPADPCCLGGGGNIDCDPNDNVDITDLTVLIDHLFIDFPPLCCSSEANIDVDTDAIVDITDLTALIDHLFITFQPIPSCQIPYLDD